MKVPEPRKLPSGAWFIQLRLNGVSVPVTASSAKECKRSAELIKAEHRAGMREIKRAEADPTLKTAIGKYIDNKRNILSPSTIRGYNTIKNQYFQGVTDTPLSQIKNWQKVVDAESAQHAPKTVRNAWRLVCSVLRENDITPPRIALPQLVTNEHAFLEPDEIKTFVAAVKDSPCCVPALLGLHSLRRSEIMALTWENIDLKNEVIHVRGSAVYDENHKLVQKKTNKNRSSRRDIPIMIPELLTALKAVPEKDRNGQVVACNPNTIWAQANRICEQNSLPKIGTHGLRHSFASLAFSSDVNMTEREVMEIGGWSDPQTVHKIYEHIARKNLLKAENKMKRFYKNANKNANKRKKVVENKSV